MEGNVMIVDGGEWRIEHSLYFERKTIESEVRIWEQFWFCLLVWFGKCRCKLRQKQEHLEAEQQIGSKRRDLEEEIKTAT